MAKKKKPKSIDEYLGDVFSKTWWQNEQEILKAIEEKAVKNPPELWVPPGTEDKPFSFKEALEVEIKKAEADLIKYEQEYGDKYIWGSSDGSLPNASPPKETTGLSAITNNIDYSAGPLTIEMLLDLYKQMEGHQTEIVVSKKEYEAHVIAHAQYLATQKKQGKITLSAPEPEPLPDTFEFTAVVQPPNVTMDFEFSREDLEQLTAEELVLQVEIEVDRAMEGIIARLRVELENGFYEEAADKLRDILYRVQAKPEPYPDLLPVIPGAGIKQVPLCDYYSHKWASWQHSAPMDYYFHECDICNAKEKVAAFNIHKLLQRFSSLALYELKPFGWNHIYSTLANLPTGTSKEEFLFKLKNTVTMKIYSGAKALVDDMQKLESNQGPVNSGVIITELIVHGGQIVSPNDGDEHYIPESKVAQLYGLKPGQYKPSFALHNCHKGCLHLYPKADGSYFMPEGQYNLPGYLPAPYGADKGA